MEWALLGILLAYWVQFFSSLDSLPVTREGNLLLHCAFECHSLLFILFCLKAPLLSHLIPMELSTLLAIYLYSHSRYLNVYHLGRFLTFLVNF